MFNAIIIWFTGMSGTGKTTMANKLNDYLIKKNYNVLNIDGDNHRNHTRRNDFSKKAITENNREIIQLCLTNKNKYDFIIVSVISPYDKIRNEAKKLFKNNYYLIFMIAKLNTLTSRDTKGLYKKAINGHINNLIGYSPGSPYEIPKYPDLIIDTTSQPVHKSFELIYKLIME
jgi:adenylylsulfate kinase-like enzyme